MQFQLLFHLQNLHRELLKQIHWQMVMQVGQMKTLVVSGAGTVTLTPANFGPGTTLTLEQNESAVLIWEGTNWQILSTYGGAVA